MTTQKTLAKRSARHLETVTRSTREIPVNSGPAKMDLTVNMGDLRAMAISEVRIRLMAARDTATDLVRQAAAAYSQAEKSLKDSAAALIQEAAFDAQAQALAATLANWLERPVTLLYEKPNSTTASYTRKTSSDALEPVINVMTQRIEGEIRLQARAKHGSNGEIIDDLCRRKDIPFSPLMLEKLAELTAAKQASDLAQQDLNSVNRQIAELTHKGDAIQSALTKAHLTGQLTDTTKILEVITSSVACMALPPAVAKAMPALPGPR